MFGINFSARFFHFQNFLGCSLHEMKPNLRGFGYEVSILLSEIDWVLQFIG